MKILVTGSNGLVGRALSRSLIANGHQVVRLVRGGDVSEIALLWDPKTGEVTGPQTASCDALVHLAGENIASRRWTKAQKAKLRESRVEATQKLAAFLVQLDEPPARALVASAIGIYGDRADEELTEESPRGTGFLADLCEEWEAATGEFVRAGTRVVHTRFGMILASEGGALAKMLPIFKSGLGGRLGHGRQWMSWVSLFDVVRALEYLLTQNDVEGAVNVVSPGPVTNAEFTKIFAKSLGRPAFIPAPAFGMRMMLGEMADELLLSSARVMPQKLLDSGFRFEHETLERALAAI